MEAVLTLISGLLLWYSVEKQSHSKLLTR